MARKKSRFKSHGSMSTINVTPMVDVMLVLLIIFMVITPMLSKGVSVDMVRARNPIAMKAADREDAVLVAITRDGQTFLGRQRIDDVDLATQVGDIISNRLDKTVYMKCDARSSYERVVEIVNILRSVGVDQVGLLTEKDESKAAPIIN